MRKPCAAPGVQQLLDDTEPSFEFFVFVPNTLVAAQETLALWEDAFDFDQFAEDIAVEARLASPSPTRSPRFDERIAVLFGEADPEAILTSAPGIGPVTGPQILARLGDPNRFRSLAGVRSFSGLVPSLNASGVSGRHGRPTRRGDAALREAIFIAADHARRIDPTLNGPELTANALRDWCRFSGTGSSYIEPGAPWENPYVESFNGRLRDEFLAVEQFDSLIEAQVLIDDWRIEYNTKRPHSSLGWLAPAAYAERWEAQQHAR